MNRKTFLSTLTTLILSPFVVKSKEPELENWIKANPALYQQIVANALKRTGESAINAGKSMTNLSERISYYNGMYKQQLHGAIIITKEDAEYIDSKPHTIPKNWK